MLGAELVKHRDVDRLMLASVSGRARVKNGDTLTFAR